MDNLADREREAKLLAIGNVMVDYTEFLVSCMEKRLFGRPIDDNERELKVREFKNSILSAIEQVELDFGVAHHEANLASD